MKRNCLKHSVNFPNKIKRKGKKPKSKKHKNKFIRKDQGNSKTQLMFPLEIFHIFNQKFQSIIYSFIVYYKGQGIFPVKIPPTD